MDQQLLARLAALEPLSRQLHDVSASWPSDRHQVMTHLDQHLAHAATAPGFQPSQPSDLSPPPLSDEPTSMTVLLDYLAAQVEPHGVQGYSGRHLAYIPLSSDVYAALGDFYADVMNPYAALLPVSPGAAALEFDLVRWCAEVTGMPADAGGVLLSGGSLAQFSAVVTARQAVDMRSVDVPRHVIYLSKLAHHSVEKALQLAGLAEVCRHTVPVDAHYRMVPQALQDAIQQDRQQGLVPWLIFASAGTTDTGSIDPLDDIATIATQQRLWFHVDAAYGGFFALSPMGRDKLHGLGRADSLILDPHKSLFLPQGSSVLLVRDAAVLRRAHQADTRHSSVCLQDVSSATQPASPVDYSPELSRPFRAPRMWLPLHRHGLAAYRAALEEKLLLALYVHARLAALPQVEVGPPPDLSVVIFRLDAACGYTNRHNQQLLDAVKQAGQFFLSSTTLDECLYLRVAILSNRTHRQIIDELLDHLATCIAAIDLD